MIKKFITTISLFSILGFGLSGCSSKTGGAATGAVAGGLVGSLFGSGTGRVVATGVGAVGGAVIGSNLSGDKKK
tara:strand:+ start:113 stop:334 length:222 start_codon:yes stop_codon:yes gene_type:complete